VSLLGLGLLVSLGSIVLLVVLGIILNIFNSKKTEINNDNLLGYREDQIW
jgi:hypothetical protein